MIQPDGWEVRCDWPDCNVISHVNDRDERPETWAHFPGGIELPSGAFISDLCATHRQFSLARLVEAIS